MYHNGFLIKCWFKDWESFWTFSLPRNSWAGPPLCSGHAGSCQNWHSLFWTLSKLRWTEGDSDQDHVAVSVLWLTPKHSHFWCRSSHALVLIEIYLNNTMLLQPFWGLIQCPLRWDNAHWFQWAVNYILYFRLKSSFLCSSLSLSHGLNLHFPPNHKFCSQCTSLEWIILVLKSSTHSQPLRTPSQSVFIALSALSVSLIKTDISYFSCNIPNQLFIIHTE